MQNYRHRSTLIDASHLNHQSLDISERKQTPQELRSSQRGVD